MSARFTSRILGSALFVATLVCSGCARNFGAHYEIPAAPRTTPESRDDSARFLDAVSITDRVAQAYYLTPDSCPDDPERPDCRTYRGSVEVCAIDCWQRPVSVTISMKPSVGSFTIAFDHGVGSFSSSESGDLEEEIVTRLTKRFGTVEKK